MTTDLRRYWPGDQTNLLMKAAFHSDLGIAGQAWRRWHETCDFDNSFWRDLCIASLAHRRLGKSGDAGVLEPRLLGLRRYIWTVGQMRIDAAKPLLEKLADSNVTFMPIKGSVLLARDPQAITYRFITDIDVLVDHASWKKAVDISLKEGWSTEWNLTPKVAVHRMRQTHHSLSLRRGAHGAVDLHQFSLLLNRQLGADVMLWKRAGQGTLSGIPVPLPHPSDQLAIVFGHCFLSSDSRSFDWVADALATISTPGFDWHLFTDVVLERELAVPAATALTYLAEELRCAIPGAVMERIVGQVREPFLSEFAAHYRNWVTEVAAECRAIYQAECIRSRRFLKHVPSPRKTSGRKGQVKAVIPEMKADQKVVLPMPSGVGPTDRVQFRLVFEVADLVPGTSALLLLRCFDIVTLELGRLLVRAKRSEPQELRGEIDGALVVGRGIDQLWLSVTNVEAFWLRKVRGLRARILRFAGKGTREADGGNESQATILGGSFEASVSRSGGAPKSEDRLLSSSL